jgi:hypothetical protein
MVVVWVHERKKHEADWWTGTEIDRGQAYYITNNGYVHSFSKRVAGRWEAV